MNNAEVIDMGRKRKSGDRYPSGDLKPRNQGPTPEHVAHRLRASGDERTSDVYPLSILLSQGFIDQRQHDAGMKLFAIYGRVIGKPFAKNLVIGDAKGKAGFDPVAALYDERWLKQAFRALDRLGRNSRVLTLRVAVHLVMPEFGDVELVRRIRAGLDAIDELPRPSVSDEEKDKAKEEAVA